MALFTDAPACIIDDLTDQDSGLLEVALGNGINVTTKLYLAHEEIQTDLQLWLAKARRVTTYSAQPELRIAQIVVTPPLRHWETMHALALVYRDAYFSQLIDRYEAKWREYVKLAGDARESFIASGVGIVTDPLPKPVPPMVTSVAGPQTGGTFYARVSWVNSRGQESVASDASSITIHDGNLMIVTAIGAPSNAVGFRVYAGPTLEALVLQNPVVLAASASYRYIPGLVTQGPLPGPGQMPDFIRPLARTSLRG